jgi:hypothetical protein
VPGVTRLALPAEAIPPLTMDGARIYAEATVLEGAPTVALRVSADEGTFAVTYLPPAMAKALAASLTRAALEVDAHAQTRGAHEVKES